MNLKKMQVFTPGNISLIFEILENGSRGLGFTIGKGVTAEIINGKYLHPQEYEEQSNEFTAPLPEGEVGRGVEKFQVFWNNTPISIPPVNTSIQKFLEKYKITKKIPPINLRSELPLGGGFGLSSASSFSSLKLLNQYFEIFVPEIELAKIIHQSELVHKTGLGDIQNQYFCGICLKEKSSNCFENISLKIPETHIYYQNLGEISTSKVITSKSQKTNINKAGRVAITEIKNDSEKIIRSKQEHKTICKNSLKNILKISKKFADEISIVQNLEIKNKIKKIEQRGGVATIGMIGQTIIADIPFPGSKKVEIYHRKNNLQK